MFKIFCLSLLLSVSDIGASKILAYYPTPSISHQVVFRPLSLELAKRGHEVIVITTGPIFPKGSQGVSPPRLKEIDLHDLSYNMWRKVIEEFRSNFDRNDFDKLTKFFIELVELQMNTDEVQKLLKDKSQKFDLIIVEAIVEGALGLSHYYKAPIIQFNSLSIGAPIFNIFGAASHPFIYPNPFHERVYNLTVLEKLNELYFEYNYDKVVSNNIELIDEVLNRIFGPGVPPFDDLRANVDMLFLNVHSFWDSNRPVPPNVMYLGGLHQKPQKDLPKDLQSYLDSSKHGVIYVSFGTNVDPTMFSADKIQTMINVFSKLPYDVLWKWNNDELPGRTKNIKISKWLPQSDLLRHPKIKLFIMQGGLQSTDEAITAGVPLIGIPVFGDQKYNVEQYIHFKIGERVDLDTISEEKLNTAIDKVLTDKSYRDNMANLRLVMIDQPLTPLERAVWWTEYVIRHKGAKHLRSPAANMSFAEYYELELLFYLTLELFFVIGIIVGLFYFVSSLVFKRVKVKKS